MKIIFIILLLVKVSAQAQIFLPIDSNYYQSKYRSDTARTNLYTSLAGKQVSGSYLTTTGNGGSLTGLTASQVGLGNVTNESKTTMFASPVFPNGFTISGAPTSGLFIVSNGTAFVNSTSTIPTSAGATANKVLLSNGTNYVLSTPTFPNASATSGKTIRSDGTNWIASTATLSDAPSTAGKVLVSDGTNWITSTPTFPNASASSGKTIRSDGTNWISSTATLSDAPSTAGKVLVSDGTNWITSTPTFPNASATSGKIIKSDGTNWTASTETYAAPGTSGNVLKSDGTNWTSAANTGEWTTLQVSGSDATTTGQTLVDVTGLVTPTLTASANYEIEAMLIVTTTAVATGTEYGVNCTGTGTTQGIIYIGPTTVSGGVQVMAENGTNVNNTAAAPAMLTTNSETGVVWIRGVVGTGTGSPTIAIRHLKVTSGTSTVKIGSIMRYRKLGFDIVSFVLFVLAALTISVVKTFRNTFRHRKL